jgi:hypothetical protein
MKKWIALGALLLLAMGTWTTIRLRKPRELLAPTSAQIAEVLPGEARTIFEQSPTLEILSLDPSSRYRGTVGTRIFHGFLLLGKARLTGEEANQARLSFYDSTVRRRHNQFRAACFNPRHGLRAVYQGRTLDLSLCFHCQNVYAYIDGKKISSGYTSREAQPDFDALLRSHQLPISP